MGSSTPLVTPRELAHRLAFATVAGAFFGLIGPFGSFGTPAPVRLAVWTVNFWAGALLVGTAMQLAERTRRRLDVPAWFAWPLAVALASAPLAAVAELAQRGIGGRPTGQTPLELYLQTLAIAAPTGLGYLGLHLMLERARGPAAPPSAAATPPPRDGSSGAAPFLDRLEPRLGRDLLALQMEDHYVRAHTARGSALILMPLGRAVEELEGVEGLRVHRSWWVARSAVEAVEADGRNLRLRLRGGLAAPVARNAAAELRRAGWLAAPRPDDPQSQLVDGGA